MTELFGVSVGGIIAAVLLAILAAVILYYLVVFVLIRRGRTKRAARLAANPDAYKPTAPQQDWHGKPD